MTPRLPDPLALLDRLGACPRGRDLVRRCWPGATWKMLWCAALHGDNPNDALWFAINVGAISDSLWGEMYRAECAAWDERDGCVHDDDWASWRRERLALIDHFVPYSLIEERLIAITKEMNGG